MHIVAASYRTTMQAISSLRNYFGTCKYQVNQFVQPKRIKADFAVASIC